MLGLAALAVPWERRRSYSFLWGGDEVRPFTLADMRRAVAVLEERNALLYREPVIGHLSGVRFVLKG